MAFFRTASTRRLLATLAVAVIVAGACAAIALAAGGGGPVPAPKPLARAVHDALTAPALRGVSARITFTNNLLDSVSVEGADPLLKGGSGRLWLTEGHVRLELQSEQGDSQLVSDGKTFWAYSARSHTVYRGTIPSGHKPESARHERKGPPSLKRIELGLARLARHAQVSGAHPLDVAGRPAYSVRVAPHQGGLVGAGQLAFDARRGVPLRVGLYARGSSSPALQLEATDITYGPVPAGVFAVNPPLGAKVVDVSTSSAGHAGKKEPRGRHAPHGRAAVARALPFTLAAPSELAGKRLAGVHMVGRGGRSGAVVTYGQGLAGIAVIEHKAEPAKRPADSGGEHGRDSLTLPRVQVNGASADELATPLGTVIRFERAGVSYVVVGSVTRATAETAARALAP